MAGGEGEVALDGEDRDGVDTEVEMEVGGKGEVDTEE